MGNDHVSKVSIVNAQRSMVSVDSFPAILSLMDLVELLQQVVDWKLGFSATIKRGCRSVDIAHAEVLSL